MSGTNPYLVLLSPEVTMLRGRSVTPQPLAWPAKDPGDTIEVSVDFAGFLQPGVTLSGVETSASGVTISYPGIDGTVVSMQVSGGVAGQSPTVVVIAHATDGQVIVRSVLMPILDLASES